MEITMQYDHGKLGNFLFNLCAHWTKFLVKHRWLYYLLACTWGIIQTAIGWIVTIVLGIAKIFVKNIEFKKYVWIYYIIVGPNYWGGTEFGAMFLRDHWSAERLNCHETGHIIGQLWVGPLYLFTIGLHSAIRYWILEIRKKKNLPVPKYDQYWAEDAATQCGKYAVWYINEQVKGEK